MRAAILAALASNATRTIRGVPESIDACALAEASDANLQQIAKIPADGHNYICFAELGVTLPVRDTEYLKLHRDCTLLLFGGFKRVRTPTFNGDSVVDQLIFMRKCVWYKLDISTHARSMNWTFIPERLASSLPTIQYCFTNCTTHYVLAHQSRAGEICKTYEATTGLSMHDTERGAMARLCAEPELYQLLSAGNFASAASELLATSVAAQYAIRECGHPNEQFVISDCSRGIRRPKFPVRTGHACRLVEFDEMLRVAPGQYVLGRAITIFHLDIVTTDIAMTLTFATIPARGVHNCKYVYVFNTYGDDDIFVLYTRDYIYNTGVGSTRRRRTTYNVITGEPDAE